MSTSWGARAVLAAIGVVVAVLLAGPAAAEEAAADAVGSGSGAEGQQLTVTPVTGMNADGQDVVVTGTGFDPAKGIYLALCVVPEPGESPTPCGGGADTTGTSGGSAWISSNPPSYAVDLVTPYGPDGSFTVELTVAAQLNADVDCHTARCAVVTRADHTRIEDRSLDVVVPISFGADAAGTERGWVVPAAAGGAVGLLAVAGGVLAIRRRAVTDQVADDD